MEADTQNGVQRGLLCCFSRPVCEISGKPISEVSETRSGDNARPSARRDGIRMLNKHSKHLSGHYRKSTHHFMWFLCVWGYVLPQVDCFFMSDSKAVLQGCDDNWTFQGEGQIPVLKLTTVCVDVRVLSPGEWTAFSYSLVPSTRYELALQGDENSLYAWLLGVRHQFPVQLTPHQWYRLCLRWDLPHETFSLTIGGNPEVYQRTVIARAIPPSGRLLLGCQPKDAPPGVTMATVELYLFRIWDDLGEHLACEDGSVVGWDSRLWAINRTQSRVQDYALRCGLGHLRKKRVARGTATTDTFYYWMSVEVHGSQLNENNLQNWFTGLFKPCSGSANTELCQAFKTAEVKCQDRQNIQCTNCTVLLEFKQSVNTCDISRLVDNGTTTNKLNNITILGEVERVGNGLCNGTRHGGDLVTCLSSMSYNDIRQIQGPVNVTCSYLEKDLNVINNQSCNGSLKSESPGTLANALLDQTREVSSLNSTQVNNLVNQLENLLSAPNISVEVGQTILSVINNLLNSSTTSLTSSSNRLIKAVDSLGLKLVIRDQTENVVFESFALTVTRADGSNFMTTSFSVADPLNPQVTKGVQREEREVKSSSLLGKITLPASLTEKLPPEQQKIASRIQFTFFQKNTFFQDKVTERILNSHILGSSLTNLSITNLKDNVTFTLQNKQPVAGNYVASCVFWDFEKNGGSGGWNSDGCVVMNSSTENETVCSCNHMTSFAVLLDISRQGIRDPKQATILTFITYIGCGTSAVFIIVTLLIYLKFEKIRRDIPSKILIHLCFGLLLLNLVFLVDSWLALYADAVGLCFYMGVCLHYFLLVSFTWMGLEALHMYLAIVRVFNNCITRYMLKFSMAGWGVPLTVVIIVIGISRDNYGLVQYGKYLDGTSDDICWLKNDITFYVAVVAYFCVIFVWNVVMFVVVMVHLVRIKQKNPHNNQYRTEMQELRSIGGLTVLLGLTWGFAYFAWGPVNLAFTYLFAIFNSFQGFFIFVFHCALKENVRKQLRTYLCFGRLRLAENADWSRTTTQNHHTKTSILIGVSSDSGSHSTPRSSVSSEKSVPSNVFGSPMDNKTDHV